MSKEVKFLIVYILQAFEDNSYKGHDLTTNLFFSLSNKHH